MLTGLGITGTIYILVSICAVASDVPRVKTIADSEGRASSRSSKAGAPDFPIDKVLPFLAVFAVANSALINMMMASRLLYGMSPQGVMPKSLSKSTPRIVRHGRGSCSPPASPLASSLRHAGRRDARRGELSDATALLLLGVFAVVNVAVLALRQATESSRRSSLRTGRSPCWPPCSASSWTSVVGRDGEQLQVAGILLRIGCVLWCPIYLHQMKGTGAGTSRAHRRRPVTWLRPAPCGAGRSCLRCRRSSRLAFGLLAPRRHRQADRRGDRQDHDDHAEDSAGSGSPGRRSARRR